MDTREYLNGKSKDGYKFFGSHKRSKGYIFRILAPAAKRAYISGDFNNWDKDKLRKYSTGVFSISMESAKVGDRYEFVIEDSEGRQIKKLDPYGRRICLDEKTSVITDSNYKFKYKKIKEKPKNIYQVHLGSLLKDSKVEDVYKKLLTHLKNNNFTHVQFMPVTEYKTYKHMGYSSLGLYAFSERYGRLDDFKKLIDMLHKVRIGTILELDIGEFDSDSLYLDNFDGKNPYNYDYENIKYNYFGSVNFDPSKNLVKSYLLSLVDYYTKELNIDGIYFSSIENMVYWQGDRMRGVNETWTVLIKEINKLVKKNNSYSLAGINGIYDDLNLGFDLVYDTEFRKMVEVFQKEPYQREKYKAYITSLITEESSNKIYGFSYVDSVINEASLAMKMYSEDMKIEQLKTLFTFLMTLKPAKMVFMGNETCDMRTFSVYDKFEFKSNNDSKFNDFYRDLTDLYKNTQSLNEEKSVSEILDVTGFSIYGYERIYNDEKILVLVNFTDISYEIDSPYNLKELLNTNDLKYKGNGNINGSVKKGEEIFIEAFGSAIFKIEK